MQLKLWQNWLSLQPLNFGHYNLVMIIPPIAEHFGQIPLCRLQNPKYQICDNWISFSIGKYNQNIQNTIIGDFRSVSHSKSQLL